MSALTTFLLNILLAISGIFTSLTAFVIVDLAAERTYEQLTEQITSVIETKVLLNLSEYTLQIQYYRKSEATITVPQFLRN